MIAIPILVVIGLLFNPLPVAGQERVPRFESGPCPFADEPWAAVEDIDCGHLVVPENRRRESDRALRLPVAILRSTSATPSADPYLFIPGGPGGGTLTRTEGIVQDEFTQRIRAQRDYVLLDLSGTGSAPDPWAGLGRKLLPVFAADLTPVEHRARCGQRSPTVGDKPLRMALI